jgi:hypothetical protein
VIFFAALLMTAAVFGLVGYPLLRPPRRQAAAGPVDGRQREEILSRRDAAYAAMKELDFEYQLGNLSLKDYEDLRTRYRDRAADVLQELDALEREAEVPRTQRSRGSRDGGAEDEIEQAVAILRQRREGKWLTSPDGAPAQMGEGALPSGGRACPTCHEPVAAGEHFCGNCGTDQLRFCPACAAPCQPGQRFCARCGELLAPS